MKGHELISNTGTEITVAGKSARYIRNRFRIIYGTIDALSFQTRYARIRDDEPMKTTLGFTGVARFEEDSFSIIENEQHKTSTLPVFLTPTTAEQEWKAALGFIEGDWELGTKDG